MMNCESVQCELCHEKYEMPYSFCCLEVCNEIEMCRGCTKGINLKLADERTEAIEAIVKLITSGHIPRTYYDAYLGHTKISSMTEEELRKFLTR